MPSTESRTSKKIFISYSGPAFSRMEQLISRLAARGHIVFIDRQGNRLGDPVSAKIEKELHGSTLCLVYYSKRYSERHACQFELMHALVADLREGGVARTLVVNPEPTKSHIHPAALKDQLYLGDDGTEAALDRIVVEVELRLSQLAGTYQGIDFSALPRIVDWRPGVESRVRRYGAMWRLHTALHAQRYRLTHQPTNGIAVLTGLPGAGKTGLVADYLLHFAHEYALVIPVDLGDASGAAAESSLRAAAAKANAMPGTSKGQALIVVENIPARVPHEFFTAGLDSPDVLLLLVSEHTDYAALGREVRLGGLTDDEARELFYRLHQFDRDDEAEVGLVDQVVAAVDNHAMAVTLLAGSATAKQGLTTLTEYVGRVLDGSSNTTTKLSDLLADRLRAVDDGYQLAVLRLLAACGQAAVPARLVRDVLTAQGMDESRVVDALEPLQSKMLLRAEQGLWSMHGLVRQAVLRHGDAVAVNWLASACADYLMRVLEAGPQHHSGDEWRLLVRHARHLVGQPGVAPVTTNALLPLIARELRRDGHVASAARYLDRLLAAGVSDPGLAVDAASDHYEVGEYEQTVTISAAALNLGSAREDVLLACLHAAALDALGRFADAGPYWQQAIEPAALDVLSEAERLQVRLRWIRGQRLRGTLKPNLAELQNLLDGKLDLPERLQHLALIELAHIQMTTGASDKARMNARRVVDHYLQRGQRHYPIAVAAEYVLATAELQLHFTERKVDPARWAAAEAALRRIAQQREEALGVRNVEVLATKVSADFALIQQGRAREALTYATALLPVLNSRLGERHPIVLRERYVHGLACGQLARFDEAVEALEHAHRGQLVALGIAHPETLQTQFEFAMALKLRGRNGEIRRANALLDEVVKRARSITGMKTDLLWQAFTGATLARLAPAAGLRRIHQTNHKHKW